MGHVVAIGEPELVEGFALAGATVIAAAEPDAVRAAWERLPETVTMVVLSPRAAGALGELLGLRPILHAVTPP